MKQQVEFPKLQELQAEAAKKGFKVTVIEPVMKEYQVVIEDDSGRKQVGYVRRLRKGDDYRYVMDTHYWGSDSKSRLRISIGKKVHIIGNKLGWKMCDPSKPLPNELNAHLIEKGYRTSFASAGLDYSEKAASLGWNDLQKIDEQIAVENGWVKEEDE